MTLHIKIRKAGVLLALLWGTFTAANGQCDPADFALLCNDGDVVNDAVFSCGFSCAFASDLTACFASCISDAIPEMSAGCVGCFANQSTCVSNNCFLQCAFGSEADCEACVAANCQADFGSCAGITDVDGDGEDSVCDCDDDNADVYTGAPGTGDGIDNNCDGIITDTEQGCPLDLTSDGLVAVSDVLIVLAEFGCTESCEADITGDGAVTVSDVLTLLSGFGTAC